MNIDFHDSTGRYPWVTTIPVLKEVGYGCRRQAVALFTFDFDTRAKVIFNITSTQTISQTRDLLFVNAEKKGIYPPQSRSMYFFRFVSTQEVLPNTDLPDSPASSTLMSSFEPVRKALIVGTPIKIEVIHESRVLENHLSSAIKRTRGQTENQNSPDQEKQKTKSDDDDISKSLKPLTASQFFCGIDLLRLEGQYTPERVKALQEMEADILSVDPKLNVGQSQEIQHFREAMARLRHDEGMPVARLSEEYLERGFKFDLPEQKRICEPTCLSVLPSELPMTFTVHIRLLDGVSLKPLLISKHHTVRKTIEQLMVLCTGPSGVSTIGLPLEKLTLKLMGKGHYYLPYELVSAKPAVRQMLMADPPQRVELSLVELSAVLEQDALSVVDHALRALDTFVPPQAPRLPHIPFSTVADVCAESSTPYISSWSANVNFAVEVVGVDGLSTAWSERLREIAAGAHLDAVDAGIYVSASVSFGGRRLHPVPMLSPLIGCSENPKFSASLGANIPISQIPSHARLCFTLWIQPLSRRNAADTARLGKLAIQSSSDKAIGWVPCPVFDFRGFLQSGLVKLPLWPDNEANEIGTCNGNLGDPSAPRLVVRFPAFAAPVVFPQELNDAEELNELLLTKRPASAVQSPFRASVASSTQRPMSVMLPALSQSSSSPHLPSVSVAHPPALRPASTRLFSSPFMKMQQKSDSSSSLQKQGTLPSSTHLASNQTAGADGVKRVPSSSSLQMGSLDSPKPEKTDEAERRGSKSSRQDDSDSEDDVTGIVLEEELTEAAQKAHREQETVLRKASEAAIAKYPQFCRPSPVNPLKMQNPQLQFCNQPFPVALPRPLSITHHIHTAAADALAKKKQRLEPAGQVDIDFSVPLFPLYRQSSASSAISPSLSSASVVSSSISDSPPTSAFASASASSSSTSTLPPLSAAVSSAGIPLNAPTSYCAAIDPRLVASVPLPSTSEWKTIVDILHRDLLLPIDKAEATLLLRHRYALVGIPAALPKYLRCLWWQNRSQVIEAHYLLRRWAPMNPADALELLDAKFADPMVRAKAVEWIDAMSDEDLEPFLLQLVQVLKNEPFHDSALARLLVKRAWNAPNSLGHALVWHLKAELHNAYIRERYGLMVGEYLKGCGKHRDLVVGEATLLTQLVGLAQRMQKVKRNRDEEKAALQKELEEMPKGQRWILPLAPDFEVGSFVKEKCRVMDSKKKPLWLTFANWERNQGNLMVLFKVGDDIRQDQLTLQVFRVMDMLWKREGLDLCLSIYGAQTTGDNEGFIEAVRESETIAHITKDAGGANKAWSKDYMVDWLLAQCGGDSALFEKARVNFAYSCAGYCVATHVLGIGDRHNDNLMCRTDGRMFHIDFGHFLGNFKKKFGIQREKAPFVFTPAFAFVLGDPGSPTYHLFQDLCVRAFNILRKNSNLLMNLFMLMLSTGIPELTKDSDILWIEKKLVLNKTEDEAAIHMKKLIEKARTCKWTQLNEWIHIKAH